MRGRFSIVCLAAILTPFALTAADEPLAFQAALNAIVERSPAIGIQRAIVESTAAKNLSSRLSLLPTVRGEASHTVSDSFGLRTTRRGLQGVAELNLFRFGSDFAAMKAASAEVRAQELLVDDTVLKTEADAIRFLVTFIQSTKEVETVQEIYQSREEALKIARSRYERGLLASQEADKFAVDLDNARARLSDAEIALISAGAELDSVLGHSNIVREWPWKEALSGTIAEFPKENKALSHRPDLQAAQERIKAADYRKDQAWGKVFPSLDINVSYGYFTSSGGAGPGPGGGPSGGSFAGPEWRGTLALSVPLFDRLQDFGTYQALVHTKTVAELELERTKRLAKSEHDSARGTLGVSLQTAKLRDQTLGISRKLYRDNLLRFRKGLVNANELIVDQERLYDSQLNAIRGWGAAHTQFTRLCHSTGRRIENCLSKK